MRSIFRNIIITALFLGLLIPGISCNREEIHITPTASPTPIYVTPTPSPTPVQITPTPSHTPADMTPTPSFTPVYTTPTPTSTLAPSGGGGGGGGGGGFTPTPTPGATATPTATPTSTPTPTGNTLGDILGVGTNHGDVKFDQAMTSEGQQSKTIKVYWKNWGTDQMKYRSEMTQEGESRVDIVDYSAQTMYVYMLDEGLAFQVDFSTWAPKNPLEGADQIIPTHLGTETTDGKLCDVYRYTTSTGLAKVWVWKAEAFPIKWQYTDSNGTTTTEYKNIAFGTLSGDLFQLPAGVEPIDLRGM